MTVREPLTAAAEPLREGEPEMHTAYRVRPVAEAHTAEMVPTSRLPHSAAAVPPLQGAP